MSKHGRYFRYILRHKLYVYQEGRKLGLGRIRLLLHDWQKFTPAEWRPYLDTFYGTKVEKAAAKDAFDRAWLHHQRSGTAHHWQSHVLMLDNGGVKPLPMPDADRREMLADWRAMGRAFGEEPPAVGWYQKNKHKMQLHPDTRTWVEAELGIKS